MEGVALTAAIAGTLAALHYHRLGLTLSHYDARGHLVVARRIIDSITPGWQQIGAVWLPLPHLLNALPVQWDLAYRTGASGVAISIGSFAVASAAVAWIVLGVTGSTLAALAGAAVFVLNPNLLYLQATPMTEPLLLALVTVAVAMLMAVERAQLAGAGMSPGAANPTAAGRRFSHATGAAFALACMTRYEAWPVTGAALALAAWARLRSGASPAAAVRAAARIAAYPAAAIAGFAIFSRVVIGEWFVAGGFFVAENKALGDPWMALKEIGWGAQALINAPIVALGSAGLAALAVAGLRERRRAWVAIALALAATAAVPFAAFHAGHPYRIRYMVPLVAVAAVGSGAAAGLAGRARVPIALAVLAAAAAGLRPSIPGDEPAGSAPMVVEAQWDLPNAPVRARVTACIGGPRPGEKIMASMGSLGHYMQETSAAGFRLRDFLHEGNGDIWLAAVTSPRPFADWIVIEEKAEGGDILARIAREHPAFLAGYSRVCEGAGLALYRRQP